jgi:hypothetical protein
MGQVTIYLDNETEKKLNLAVKKAGISKSKWIAEKIQEKISTTWPESIREIAGAWDDLPTAEEIRADMAKDNEREPI